MAQSHFRTTANQEAHGLMCAANPILEDVRPAREVVPHLPDNMILASGPTMPWSRYHGGQRAAIIGAARYEGLASTAAEAEAKLANGEIQVAGCQDYACVGSLAGVYSASMAVFVVRDAQSGKRVYCNFYEGQNPRRLNYGVYDEGVHQRLLFIDRVIAPVVGEAVRRAGGVPLKPLMIRALHMGDELHSRNTAASLLFCRALMPELVSMARDDRHGVDKTIALLTEDHYFFLRLSMAAAKAIADAAHGVKGSSIVTAMALNCNEFGVRISGLGDRWFCGELPEVRAKLFDGFSEDDIAWMGGESMITETVGLGAFAQAAAFPLQAYQGGDPETMVERNLSLYEIVQGDNTAFKIPFLRFRGTPTGIDLFKVLETGIGPLMNMGIAGAGGGQIGAGYVRARMGCFEQAARAFKQQYGEGG